LCTESYGDSYRESYTCRQPLTLLDIVRKGTDHYCVAITICSQVVEFASALLEGGNQEIQDSFFNKLQSSDISQGFFKVFYDKMDEAQSEIKSTVTVNTTDITARAHDDNESAAKDIDKVVKKKGRK
jgi:inositol 1,4,5-triphosphate receptor type 1